MVDGACDLARWPILSDVNFSHYPAKIPVTLTAHIFLASIREVMEDELADEGE
jgi:hypothetical protein